MDRKLPGAAPLILSCLVLAGGTPANAPPASAPRNIDNALASLVTIEAHQRPLAEVFSRLRELAQINMAINWNALAQAGITRQTPVDLDLKDLALEQVIKTLVEVLPTPPEDAGKRLNYAVGDNTLTLTTNADLGKGNVPRLIDVAHALSYTLEPTLTQATRDQNGHLLEEVLRAQLERSGEPLAAPGAGAGHGLAIKEVALGATLSARGQGVLDRALVLFNAPLKLGQLAAGTQLTPAARKCQDAFKALGGAASDAAAVAAAIAAAPDKYRVRFNIALLPGTAEELAKPPAARPDLATAITDGGVLLIGPRERLRLRTVLAVYDLRDLIRRLKAKNPKKPQASPADYQAAILQILQTNLSPSPAPEKWGGLEDLAHSPPSPSCLIPYNGLLIVFATPDTHRAVAAALQDMYK